MVAYKVVKKCLKVGCEEMFEGKGHFCEKHKILQINNPKGYNKFKKNLVPKKNNTELITKETVKEAYIELWKAKRELLSKAQKFARVNKIFCGLDLIDKELNKLKA